MAVWRVRPTRPPALVKRCPRCDAVRPFLSSDRFRINAQGHRLDVWLIYRCEKCDQTYNREVHARVSPESLEANRYAAYLANDRDLAWSVAFAPTKLPTLAVQDFVVEVSHEASRVRLAVPWPVKIRLDRVLALGLCRSRAAISADLRSDRIRLVRGRIRAAMNVQDGMVIALD